MTDKTGTADQLVLAARALFAEHGYHGTSVRAITQSAGVNLGAITYHFGSKQALYEAAFASLFAPTAQHLVRAVDTDAPPLDRIERAVQAIFDYLRTHPQLPRILAHHLALRLPLADVARDTLRHNLGLLAGLITDGQRNRTIRDGNPTFLALSVIAQPLYLALVQDLLRHGMGLDQTDPEAHAALRDSVIEFVRAGLARSEQS